MRLNEDGEIPTEEQEWIKKWNRKSTF
jgi:hypothetical protein